MAQNIQIDSHKLMYHPKSVAKWLDGGDVYPIEIEISPSGTCNHRCIFCALDYMEYTPVFLDKNLILTRIKEMAGKGLKSVIMSGEGEPLLNKNTPEIVNEIKSYGVDVAMSSNAVLLTREVSEKCLKSLSWIRFSVAAGEEEAYMKIHKAKAGDFEKAINNIAEAVKVKKAQNLNTTLGVQMLLIPENTNQVVLLAKKLKEIGIDYFSVKPFSKHPKSICGIDENFHYENYDELKKELDEFETEDFKIYFRVNAMSKLKKKRGYNKCWGLPFFVHVDASLNVYPCVAFVGDKNLSYGNLKDSNFEELWNSEQRKKVNQYFEKNGVANCREICRLDEINNYLEKLKNPQAHDNFI